MYDGDPQSGSEQSTWSSTKNSYSKKLAQNETPLSAYKDAQKSDSNISQASCSSVSASCQECRNNSASPPPTVSSSQEECRKDKDSIKSPSTFKKNQAESENHVHVDIRMIDFAKSTHQDMDSTVIHDGPDHGYIFGLTNLIKILKEFRKSATTVDSTCSENPEL